MCSACENDDPRPEMFTSFDISSPKSGSTFAGAGAGGRKFYGTRMKAAQFAKPALLLGIMRAVLRGGLFQCAQMRKVGHAASVRDRGDFPIGNSVSAPSSHEEHVTKVMARENLRCLRGWKAVRVASIQVGGLRGCNPIEIWVTPNEIIEIYNSSGVSDASGNEVDTRLSDSPEAWSNSRAPRANERRATPRFHHARMTQLVAGYVCFAALAAIAIWCIMK